jgi:hypothetical protein
MIERARPAGVLPITTKPRSTARSSVSGNELRNGVRLGRARTSDSQPGSHWRAPRPAERRRAATVFAGRASAAPSRVCVAAAADPYRAPSPARVTPPMSVLSRWLSLTAGLTASIRTSSSSVSSRTTGAASTRRPSMRAATATAPAQRSTSPSESAASSSAQGVPHHSPSVQSRQKPRSAAIRRSGGRGLDEEQGAPGGRRTAPGPDHASAPAPRRRALTSCASRARARAAARRSPA